MGRNHGAEYIYIQETEMAEEQQKTGFPHIDKPWLKYYYDETRAADIPQCTLYQFLKESTKNYSELDAIEFFGTKIKYKTLMAEIDAAAKGFVAAGVKKGDIVTIFTSNLPEMVYSVYALNRIGAIFNMEYVTSTEKDAVAAVERCNSKVIMIMDALLTKFAEIPGKASCVEKCIILPLGRSMPFFKRTLAKSKLGKFHCAKEVKYDDFIAAGKDVKLPAEEYVPNAVAAILHSGGTTGVPKGVLIAGESFNSVVWECMHCGANYEAGDRFFHSIPPFHAFGMGTGVHMPLCLGLCTTMMVKFDDETILKEFERCRPNHVFVALPHANLIVQNTKITDFSKFKTMVMGGAAVPEEQEKAIDKFLHDHGSTARPMVGYGMSELSSAVCIENNRWYGKVGSVGIPFSKSVVRVVDPDSGESLPYNKEGELWFAGPGVMLGYYKNEAETNNVISVDEDGTRWMHTGDMGHVDEDGFVFITGRMKRIYSVRNEKGGAMFKMFPDYITNIIDQYEGVKDSAVVCIPNPDFRHVAIAYIIPEEGVDKDELYKGVLAHCKSELAGHLIPRKFFFVDEIPFTPIGKPDFHKLEDDATKRTEGEVFTVL